MSESIGEFNRRLNASLVFKETSKGWANYKKEVTRRLSVAMKHGGRTVLFGAGNLLDIEIDEIAGISESIVLADIDTESVKGAVSLSMLNKEKVRIEQTDLGGLDIAGLPGEIDGYLASGDYAALARCLGSFRPSSFNPAAGGEFDNVLFSPVYTQLFIPWFMERLNAHEVDAKKVAILLEPALSLAAGLIREVNDSVLSCAGGDAVAAVWSDILEYRNDDPVLDDIRKNIGDAGWMDMFYQNYELMHGHGLGSYGIHDMVSRLLDVSQDWMLWPVVEN
ncbi:MAG: hypothetical protein JXB33_01810, partial [Clostridia bacterium]|nr:hypothetical protein [Clostridia bacterium]